MKNSEISKIEEKLEYKYKSLESKVNYELPFEYEQTKREAGFFRSSAFKGAAAAVFTLVFIIGISAGINYMNNYDPGFAPADQLTDDNGAVIKETAESLTALEEVTESREMRRVKAVFERFENACNEKELTKTERELFRYALNMMTVEAEEEYIGILEQLKPDHESITALLRLSGAFVGDMRGNTVTDPYEKHIMALTAYNICRFGGVEIFANRFEKVFNLMPTEYAEEVIFGISDRLSDIGDYLDELEAKFKDVKEPETLDRAKIFAEAYEACVPEEYREELGFEGLSEKVSVLSDLRFYSLIYDLRISSDPAELHGIFDKYI